MADAPLIFHYGQAVPQCDHRIDKHFEGYCTLQYMSGGAVALSIDGDRRLLEGRWFWSCYPGPRIAFCPAIERSTWNHRYLAFSGDLVRT